MNTKLYWLWLMVGLCAVPPALSCAGEDQAQPAADQPVEVDFFAAVKSGQLQVAVVPHSYSAMTMRVRNKSRQVLKVSLPKSFAAIPTTRWKAQQSLAQQGRPPSLGDGYIVDPNGSQGLAGSLWGPWATGGAAVASSATPAVDDAQPTATWTLAAGQLIEIQLPCFCLEYGKPDPTRRIPYQLVELQDLNSLPAVQELLERFAKEGLDQRVVQLAAWHVANGVPWPMLARVKFPRSAGRGGGTVSPQELVAARQLSESLPSYGVQPSLGNQ